MRTERFGLSVHTFEPYTVEVPETVGEASATFECAPQRCKGVTGEACARRHMLQRDATPGTALGPCRECPAGAARLELLGVVTTANRHSLDINRIHGWVPADKRAPKPARKEPDMSKRAMVLDWMRTVGTGVSVSDVSAHCGISKGAASSHLTAALNAGEVVRPRRGIYVIAGLAETPPAELTTLPESAEIGDLRQRLQESEDLEQALRRRLQESEERASVLEALEAAGQAELAKSRIVEQALRQREAELRGSEADLMSTIVRIGSALGAPAGTPIEVWLDGRDFIEARLVEEYKAKLRDLMQVGSDVEPLDVLTREIGVRLDLIEENRRRRAREDFLRAEVGRLAARIATLDAQRRMEIRPDLRLDLDQVAVSLAG